MGDVIKHLAVATTKVALTCAGSPNALKVPPSSTQAPPDYSSAASPTLHSSCESKATKATTTPHTTFRSNPSGQEDQADCCNDDSHNDDKD